MKQILLMIAVVAMVGGVSYDWSGEVGTYTLDQAVVEFGPPDATSKLSDGGTFCAWYHFLSRYSHELYFDKDGVFTGSELGRVGPGGPADRETGE
jgi:hypothetical protein